MMPECGIESLWSRGAMTTAFPADFAQARSKGGLDFDAVAAAIYSQYGKAFSRFNPTAYPPEGTPDALYRIPKMPLSTIINKHLGYTYDNGWRYEFWLKSEKRIVYEIHGGPMAGRFNYQTSWVQEIREDEIYQISWVEETGTVVSINVDLPNKRIFTFMTFSQGHWEKAEDAHGDKRNDKDFDRWRGLAKFGGPKDRHTIMEQATIQVIEDGKPDYMKDIEADAETL